MGEIVGIRSVRTMRDVTDLFNDLKNGTLPAVSYASLMRFAGPRGHT